jgi:hypothetical protein
MGDPVGQPVPLVGPHRPTLRFTHFDPPLKTLKARFAVEEIAELLDLVDGGNFSPEERAQAREEVVALALDPDAARSAVAEHDDPKEPAPADALPTSSELIMSS